MEAYPAEPGVRRLRLPRGRGWLPRILTAIICPPRRNSVALAKWAFPRFIILMISVLLVTDHVAPILGDYYLPPRTLHPPSSPYGLSLVDTLPANHPVAVDVVFVHGLGAFPDSTWVKRKNDKARGLLLHEQISWVRDLLPQDVPQARLLFFNYDSTTYNDAPSKTLNDIAGELLLAFSNGDRSLRYTKDERRRPIIFVCHSYGGLVVKNALVKAHTDPAEYSDLIEHTHGVVFLGTPHQGTKYADHARAIALRLDQLGSNPDIFVPLRVNSSSLQILHENFMWNFGHLNMANLYETRKLTIFTTWFWRTPYKVMIVDKSSAVFEAPNTINVAVDTHHSGLNKFDAGDDYNYVKVVRAIRRIIRMIIEQRTEHRKTQAAHDASTRKNGTTEEFSKDLCRGDIHYLVPWRTVSTFTQRNRLQAQLEELMQKVDHKSSPPTSVALWGAGASGKSQLALRYAEEHRHLYNPIIWIDASTPATAVKSFSRAFESLGLEYLPSVLDDFRKTESWKPHYKSMLRDDWVVTAVLEWLEARSDPACRWLVIIDNADDVYWVRDLIPRGPGGAVIITSRDLLVQEYVDHHIEVDHLTIEEGLQLVLHEVHPVSASASTNRTNSQATMLQKQQALPIVETLGCSALLLDLANRYIRQHAQVLENITRYLDYHDEMSLSLLDNPALGLETHYRFTVAAVYETSFANIIQISNDSAQLLYLFAVLSNGMIEDRLFQEASVSLAAARRLFSTYHFMAIAWQSLLCSLLPYLTIVLILRYLPWAPNLVGRTRTITKRLMIIVPVLMDGIYLLVLFVIDRSMIENGTVVTQRGNLQRNTIVFQVYLSLAYAWPIVAEWLLQQHLTGFWFRTVPYTLPTAVFLLWIWAKLYYGLDNTLEHHIRGLLNRLDLTRTSMVQFEQAITGLHNLARERMGIQMPLQLAWHVLWGMALHFIFSVLGTMIELIICYGIAKLLAILQRRTRSCWQQALIWILWLLQHPIIIVVCFSLGIAIGGTGISYWIPWAKDKPVQISIPPEFVNGLLDVETDGGWNDRRFHETAAILVKYGLLHRSPQIGYTLHPHIQWWARQRMEPAMMAAWAREAERLLELVYQSPNCWGGVFCQQMLIPHLIAVAGVDIQYEDTGYERLKSLLQMLWRSLWLVGRV